MVSFSLFPKQYSIAVAEIERISHGVLVIYDLHYIGRYGEMGLVLKVLATRALGLESGSLESM